mgnify:CR=1 FL=1
MICLEEQMQQWCVEVWVDTRIKVGCICVGKTEKRGGRMDSKEGRSWFRVLHGTFVDNKLDTFSIEMLVVWTLQ